MRKPVARHKVTRKSKSGKVTTFYRGKGVMKSAANGWYKIGDKWYKKPVEKKTPDIVKEAEEVLSPYQKSVIHDAIYDHTTGGYGGSKKDMNILKGRIYEKLGSSGSTNKKIVDTYLKTYFHSTSSDIKAGLSGTGTIRNVHHTNQIKGKMIGGGKKRGRRRPLGNRKKY